MNIRILGPQLYKLWSKFYSQLSFGSEIYHCFEGPPQLIILIPFESVSEITSFGIIGPVRNIRSWCLQGINFHIRCLVCWHVLAEGVSTIISFWKEHSMGLLEKRLCTQHPRVSPWFLHGFSMFLRIVPMKRCFFLIHKFPWIGLVTSQPSRDVPGWSNA